MSNTDQCSWTSGLISANTVLMINDKYDHQLLLLVLVLVLLLVLNIVIGDAIMFS